MEAVYYKITYTHKNVVNIYIYIVYELNLWTLFVDTTKFKLGNSLFGAVKLTKNADPDRC